MGNNWMEFDTKKSRFKSRLIDELTLNILCEKQNKTRIGEKEVLTNFQKKKKKTFGPVLKTQREFYINIQMCMNNYSQMHILINIINFHCNHLLN